jgi:hypothetical protein
MPPCRYIDFMVKMWLGSSIFIKEILHERNKMNFLKHILLSLSVITLASCQSVDYYGKSYEKNGFFHCMMLEDSEIVSYGYVTDEEKTFCSNYKEKLQKIVSTLSLTEEKNYYEQSGAKCQITLENNTLQCSYNAEYTWFSAYYTRIYGNFSLDILSNKYNVQFKKHKKSCSKVQVEKCGRNILDMKKKFTINKNITN